VLILLSCNKIAPQSPQFLRHLSKEALVGVEQYRLSTKDGHYRRGYRHPPHREPLAKASHGRLVL
jgi:hypothetical protein